MTTLVRRVTTVGNSLGVTLPLELAQAYGLARGNFVELEPTDRGLLLKPVRVVSALEPAGKRHIQGIIQRYRPALDAMARHDRKIASR